MSRIDNRPEPSPESPRRAERERTRDSQVARDGGRPKNPAAFRQRLQETTPDARRGRPAAEAKDLPVLDRPLPGAEARVTPPPNPEARPATALPPRSGEPLRDDPAVGPKRREDRGAALEPDVDPGAAGIAADPAAAPRTAATAPAPPPAAPTPVLDPALLQQVVAFSAVSRNDDGQHELVLGTSADFLGGTTMRLIALGGGRLALRYRPGKDVAGSREGIAALAQSMRRRGVELVDVEEE